MAQDQLHLETIRIAVQRPERVEKLMVGMPALERSEGMVLYYALIFLRIEVRILGLGRKIRKERAISVLLVLRALLMPWLLTHERQVQALFHSRWSLSYETG